MLEEIRGTPPPKSRVYFKNSDLRLLQLLDLTFAPKKLDSNQSKQIQLVCLKRGRRVQLLLERPPDFTTVVLRFRALENVVQSPGGIAGEPEQMALNILYQMGNECGHVVTTAFTELRPPQWAALPVEKRHCRHFCHKQNGCNSRFGMLRRTDLVEL